MSSRSLVPGCERKNFMSAWDEEGEEVLINMDHVRKFQRSGDGHWRIWWANGDQEGIVTRQEPEKQEAVA
jgi:hypothetical protein